MTTLRSVTRRLFERMRDESVDVDAEFVVSPSSMEEAAVVLSAASGAAIPVSFYGAGTHRGYGNPTRSDLVVTSSRLNRIVDWQPDDLTVVVEAGVSIETLEEEIAARRQTAVLPETAPGATVGGVVAAGFSGYRRLRYGPTRDRVLQVQIATGYGKVVTGGSPVVKSSTGYGLPRLFTGSIGSLGMIGTVTLKLWSQPLATATVEVGDAATALRGTYRPLAALETSEGSFLYLGGTDKQVTSQARSAGGDSRPGLDWPTPITRPVRIQFRVPAPSVPAAIERAKRLGAARWIAEHGVGRVEAGLDGIDDEALAAARAWTESTGGALVVTAGAGDGVDPWGTPPASIEIQRRVKAAFDPAGICNPGIMPGGV
ncbi:MAG: FAD-binding oxidoreductase [Actinomycetota bacterium]|nr:FAD-binding oxidoreductase [Actinomycetota bacterium]